MTKQDLRSIGSPIFLALAIVSTVALSARLYKDNAATQKAEAAMLSSAVACAVQTDGQMIP